MNSNFSEHTQKEANGTDSIVATFKRDLLRRLSQLARAWSQVINQEPQIRFESERSSMVFVVGFRQIPRRADCPGGGGGKQSQGRTSG